MHSVAQSSALSLKVSDEELAGRIGDGDMKAFEHLMRLNNRTLFRTARAILRDDAEAEEVVQDAYLRAHRSIGAFRGESKLSTWLVRIAVNTALMRRRKVARRAAIVPIYGDVEDAGDEMQADRKDVPDMQAERKAMRQLLEQKIDALPDVYREVFVLRALEELSVDETSAALGIPAATVRTRFFRARSQLREALSQEIDLAFDDAFSFLGERCDRIVSRVMEKLADGPTPTFSNP
jgi:RNA polymerase sigma-70 factor (ECF subfamily)